MDFIHLLVSTARTATNGSYLYVPILAMSATFTISDQASFNKLIRRQPTMVFWGDMNRRNITFNVQVAGNPTHLLMSDWTKVAATETPQQSIVYSNSAMACDDVLIPRLTSTAGAGDGGRGSTRRNSNCAATSPSRRRHEQRGSRSQTINVARRNVSKAQIVIWGDGWRRAWSVDVMNTKNIPAPSELLG